MPFNEPTHMEHRGITPAMIAGSILKGYLKFKGILRVSPVTGEYSLGMIRV